MYNPPSPPPSQPPLKSLLFLTLSSSYTSFHSSPYIQAENVMINPRFFFLVTGGGGTLALVNAHALLDHCLSGLALFDLDIASTADQIACLSHDFPQARILSLCGDVTDLAQIEREVAQSTGQFGPVSILCCFAGMVECTHGLDMAPSGPWRLTRPDRFYAPRNSLASISTHRTSYPQPQSGYNASKAPIPP